ncbi:MAG TPA: thioredoxin [Candidatus Binatia bacterium]|jgi:thioredoxin 1|nr:thioredoxin [Candidatus Binatia bacterium]
MSDKVTAVNGNNFESVVLRSEIPVLVDFWAEWCGPCRSLAPTIERIAARYIGAARVVKVNIEDEPQMLRQYGISGVPTLILFKDGAEQERAVGTATAEAIASMIDRHLAHSEAARKAG